MNKKLRETVVKNRISRKNISRDMQIKRRLCFTLAVLSVVFLGTMLPTDSYAVSGAAPYDGDKDGECKNPNGCTGNGGGTIAPYWVYFRIKDNAPSDSKKWIIAGKDVSGCKNTEGLYFSFNAGDKVVSQPQQTMPTSGWNWSNGQLKTQKSIPFYYTTQNVVRKVSSSVYDSKVFEPEYITLKGQTAPNGIVHKPLSSKKNYTIDDLNKNGKYTDGFIDYSSPNDAMLFIMDRWNKSVRLLYFEGNDFYYNPNDKSHPYGKYCKLPNGNYSVNACSIYAYPYTRYDGVKAGYYSGGNNGAKAVKVAGKGVRSEFKIEYASRVNITFFCSSTSDGKFTGKSDGKVKSGATEATDKYAYDSSTEKITRYYDGTRSDGKYTVNFTHTIKRIDNNTNKRIKPVQAATIVTTVDGKQTKKETWNGIRLNSGDSTSKTSSVADVEAKLGKDKVVCQTLTYQLRYEDGISVDGTKSSTACVVITQSVILTPGSASYVDNSVESNLKDPALTGDTKTVDSYAGSKKNNFTYGFTHQIKVEGVTGYSAEIEYYVTQTRDGKAETVPNGGSESKPNKQSINSGNNEYQTVFPSTGKWDSLSEGGKTPTICQTIHFRPKKLAIKTNSGTASVASGDNVWQTSTVCTLVKRRKSTKITISATSNVTVDGKKNPSGPVISTRDVKVDFDFTINNDTEPKDRKLTTKYNIERLVYSSGQTKDWSKAETVATNVSLNLPQSSKIINSLTIKRTDNLLGKTVIVCERIKLDPNTYRVDYKANGKEDGVTANSGSGYSGEKCATIAWPNVAMIDDGEITIYSKSSAIIDDPENAGYDAATDTYLMKGEKATVTYTHELWRGQEYHTGGNKAEVGEGENAEIRYRLDDPDNTFTNTSIADAGDLSVLPSLTLATKKREVIYSDTNENFKNAKTTATAAQAGVGIDYCQSINYLSDKYTLRGSYYQIDGQIYGNNQDMISAGTPRAHSSVGKSDPGCVTVVRPYNFKVDKISVTGSPDTVTGESEADVSFQIDVTKNTDDYMITAIPNAEIRFIKLTITEPLTKNDSTAGGTVSGDPCAHFTNTLGAKARCELADSDNKTIAPGSIIDNGNAGYYPSDGYNASYTYQASISDTPTTYKICYAMAINPRSSGSKGYAVKTSDFDTTWVVSDAACINIGKRPIVQVWGGSIFSSGGIHTALARAKVNNETQSRTFGSWTDYMIVANSTNKNMASGATLISGMLNTTTCKYSPLTVANSKCNADTKELGKAVVESTNSLERGVYEYYIKNSNDKYLDLKTTDREGSSHIVTRSTLNDASGTYPIFIYNNDDQHQNLYIKEDINVGFSGRTYSDINIPQVIIYTPGNIYISPQVTRIDAWIIAGGEVRTCADVDGKVIRTDEGRIDECDKQLTITGPVYAKKILFDRTAKGDVYVDESGKNSITEPAELIDLSPATYLFGYNESTNNAQPTVTYVHKLPVRF